MTLTFAEPRALADLTSDERAQIDRGTAEALLPRLASTAVRN
jgi:hypothetical protein